MTVGAHGKWSLFPERTQVNTSTHVTAVKNKLIFLTKPSMTVTLLT